MESGTSTSTNKERTYIVNPSSGRTWINFKELRASLRFEDVLRRYGVEVRRKGAQHSGPCPLPGHGEARRAPTFSANLDRGIFQCFGCRAKGNLLEFAALMEGADPGSGSALREVAVRLRESLLSPKAAKEEPPAQAELPVQELPARGERGSAAAEGLPAAGRGAGSPGTVRILGRARLRGGSLSVSRFESPYGHPSAAVAGGEALSEIGSSLVVEGHPSQTGRCPLAGSTPRRVSLTRASFPDRRFEQRRGDAQHASGPAGLCYNSMSL